MGAYLDTQLLTAAQRDEVIERVMLPALHRMNEQGTPFHGFLYAGLMMTAEGPKLLEFNVRLGDPETQAIMHSFTGDLGALLWEAANGSLPDLRPENAKPSVCVVLAAEGYPDQPRIGDEITGVGEAEAAGANVFQAGTKQEGTRLLTNGGRVLGVTTGGNTLQVAIKNAYAAAAKIRFEGMHYRRDIGHKSLRRC
jgi:phosphoribosylamine--glycine ligase